MVRLVLLNSLFLLRLPSAVTTQELLEADDDCQADGEETCALSALQRSGVKKIVATSGVSRHQEADLEKLNVTAERWGVTGSMTNQLYLRRRRSFVSEESKIASRNCSHVTAGTCKYLSCSSSRGPTGCVNGQCLCQEGYCSNAYGVCVDPLAPKCVTDEAITSCRWMGCSSSYGQTKCENQQCFCAEGLCWNRLLNVCEEPNMCNRDTGSSCRVLSCAADRGPAECVNHKCVCPNGYCAKDNGNGYAVCELQSSPNYLAKVAAVNQEQPEFPEAHNKVVRGLSFSGGGARALSNAMGAYRALEDLQLMKHVDAISSVSGGTWASSIFMFAKERNGDNMPKEKLLGKATKPEELLLEVLDREPALLGKAVTKSCHPFLKNAMVSKLPSDQLWQMFIADTILKDFGLDNWKKFMAKSEDDVKRIKQENPTLSTSEFNTLRSDRPKVFVMNGVLLSPLGFASGPNKAVALQMSPDYTGSPFWPQDRSVTFQPADGGALYPLHDQVVGGGMVETFAFGGKEPVGNQSESGRQHIPPPHEPFTVAHAVGISSIAPGAVLANSGNYNWAAPRAQYWPVTPANHRGKVKALEYACGDGGNLENSGLIPLIQRNARKAVMWVSTYIPLGRGSKRYPNLDFCSPPADWDTIFGDKEDLVIAPMVTDKFGFPYEDKSGSYYTHNQVFPKEDIGNVMCGLQKLMKAGKPLVYKSKHKIVQNDWWGIKGGREFTLMIVYLEQCTEFEKQLPESTRQALGPANSANRTWKTSGEFARFPQYKTTSQTEEKTEITRLTNREVNLLAAQSEYAVRSNEDLFREMICPDGVSPTAVCCRNPLSTLCKAGEALNLKDPFGIR